MVPLAFAEKFISTALNHHQRVSSIHSNESRTFFVDASYSETRAASHITPSNLVAALFSNPLYPPQFCGLQKYRQENGPYHKTQIPFRIFSINGKCDCWFCIEENIQHVTVHRSVYIYRNLTIIVTTDQQLSWIFVTKKCLHLHMIDQRK